MNCLGVDRSLYDKRKDKKMQKSLDSDTVS